MDNPLLRTFSFHYRRKYDAPVGKIPLDVNVVCPNRELGGCIYCRPASFTPGCLDHEDTLDTQIKKAKKHLLKGRFAHYFGYFQQETVTAIPAEELLAKGEQVLQDPACLGLILSTRPDYLFPDFLSQLSELVAYFEKECLIEIGVQSIHPGSLQLLNRNHSVEDSFEAIRAVSATPNLDAGAHLIFGIPGESPEDMYETVRSVCTLGVRALKLHHLQVIADTPLHSMYLQGKIAVFSLEEYLDLLLTVIPMIPEDVVLHRLWTTSHPDILVAPKWNILAGELSKQLRAMLVEKGVKQGSARL